MPQGRPVSYANCPLLIHRFHNGKGGGVVLDHGHAISSKRAISQKIMQFFGSKKGVPLT